MNYTGVKYMTFAAESLKTLYKVMKTRVLGGFLIREDSYMIRSVSVSLLNSDSV